MGYCLLRESRPAPGRLRAADLDALDGEPVRAERDLQRRARRRRGEDLVELQLAVLGVGRARLPLGAREGARLSIGMWLRGSVDRGRFKGVIDLNIECILSRSISSAESRYYD